MSEIATVQPSRQQFDLSPQTFEQALTFCNYLAESDLVPKEFKGKPANCLIAIQWGVELGLKPLQALQNLAVINGRPTLWGDAVLAIVRASPLCEYVVESDDGQVATCKVKRRGEPEESRTFSTDDAKTAGLLGKGGPWTQYPNRMRQMRARAFALRDKFTDVLRGMPIAEEVMDIQVSQAPDSERIAPTHGPLETQTQQPEFIAQELPPYPEDEFNKNFGTWSALINRGKKSADEVIAMVQTKYTLTPGQLGAIRDLETTEAEVVE